MTSLAPDAGKYRLVTTGDTPERAYAFVLCLPQPPRVTPVRAPHLRTALPSYTQHITLDVAYVFYEEGTIDE